MTQLDRIARPEATFAEVFGDRPHVSAYPDQLAALGHYVSREWGFHGYRIVAVGTWGNVTGALVRSSDGGFFIVAADKFENCQQIPDDPDGASNALEAMHARTLTV